jgi:glycosyltransferase involved in cell wall biosynthesis
MRIGIYDPYLDDLGGGEKYMLTIAECLAKSHDVSIFWDDERDIEKVKERFSLNLDNVERVKNIFSPRVGVWERLSQTNRYDAIVVLSDGSIPLVLSRKLFIHLQQPIENMDTTSLKSKFKLSKVSSVFYNSQFTKSYNEKNIDSRIKSLVIYPPVEIRSEKPFDKLRVETSTRQKENIILHVGRFRLNPLRPAGTSSHFALGASRDKQEGKMGDFKKQGIMIETFKKMVDAKLGGWKFVIAAAVKKEDEEAFSNLQKAAKGYPIEFLINKSIEDLWSVYSKAKIYWHASGYGEDLEKHPEYAEHFGISTVESMGAGAVPVVINAGGQKEIMEDGKDGFLWNTLDELQGKTKLLIEDEALWKKMSEEAKARAKDFDKEKFCKAVHDLVEDRL